MDKVIKIVVSFIAIIVIILAVVFGSSAEKSLVNNQSGLQNTSVTPTTTSAISITSTNQTSSTKELPLGTTNGNPSVTILSPKSGEILYTGKSYNISWDSSLENTGLKIQLLKNESVLETLIILPYSFKPASSWLWSIPSNLEPDSDYKIKIIATDYPESYISESKKTFTIKLDLLQVITKAVGIDDKKLNECINSGKYKSLIDQWRNDAQTAKVQGTPTFFINGEILFGAQPYDVFAKTIDKALKTSSSTSTIAEQNISNDPFLGNKNASVTIIEYSSYTCIHCTNFHKTTFPQLKKDYIDTGKVKFILRTFAGPLPGRDESLTEDVLCSLDQGKYWEFSDYVFNNIGSLTISQ